MTKLCSCCSDEAVTFQEYWVSSESGINRVKKPRSYSFVKTEGFPSFCLLLTNSCELTGSMHPVLIFFLHLPNTKDGKSHIPPLHSLQWYIHYTDSMLIKKHAVMQSFIISSLKKKKDGEHLVTYICVCNCGWQVRMTEFWLSHREDFQLDRKLEKEVLKKFTIGCTTWMQV